MATASSTASRGAAVNHDFRALDVEQVVFSAGSLGTQKLLHQLKQDGLLPNLSDRLGELTREPILGATARNHEIDYSTGRCRLVPRQCPTMPRRRCVCHSPTPADPVPGGARRCTCSAASTLRVPGQGSPVLVETRRDGDVVVVTLNDPDRRNAMTVAMGEALEETFRSLADDITVRAAVLTGAPPAFSGGGDLDMLESHARRAREEGFDATETMREFYERFLAVVELPVPTIAAINGHAIGAGLCVALACDLAVVADDAKVGLNFAKLALHPGMGGSWLLPRAVGWQRGAELLYTGRIISGADAAEYGIALESVPVDEVLHRALAIADDIAASSPVVVRQLKQALAASRTSSLREQLDREAAAQATNYASEDMVEGLAAIRERRRPEFTGR